MNPLIIAGLVIAAIGVIASSGTKKSADDTKSVGNKKPAGKKKPAGRTRQKGGVAPDATKEIPTERVKGEVIGDKDTPDNDGKNKALLETMLASALADMPSRFKGIGIEDLRVLQAEDPHEIPEQAAVIFRKVSRLFRKKGDHTKADLWEQFADYVRDYPNNKGEKG